MVTIIGSWIDLYCDKERELIGDGDGSGSVGEDSVYRESAEPMLVSPSNSYLNNEISICDSRPSSCSAYTILLTTFYCY